MSNNRPPLKRTVREKQLNKKAEQTDSAEIENTQPVASDASHYQSSEAAIRERRAQIETPTAYESMPSQTPKRNLPHPTEYKSMPQQNKSGEIPGFPRNINSTAVLNQLLEENPGKRPLPRPPVTYETLPPAPEAPPKKPTRPQRELNINLLPLENKLAIIAENLIKSHPDRQHYNFSYKVIPEKLTFEMTVSDKNHTKSVTRIFKQENIETIDRMLKKIPKEDVNSLNLKVVQEKQAAMNEERNSESSIRPRRR